MFAIFDKQHFPYDVLLTNLVILNLNKYTMAKVNV